MKKIIYRGFEAIPGVDGTKIYSLAGALVAENIRNDVKSIIRYIDLNYPSLVGFKTATRGKRGADIVAKTIASEATSFATSVEYCPDPRWRITPQVIEALQGLAPIKNVETKNRLKLVLDPVFCFQLDENVCLRHLI